MYSKIKSVHKFYYVKQEGTNKLQTHMTENKNQNQSEQNAKVHFDLKNGFLLSKTYARS